MNLEDKLINDVLHLIFIAQNILDIFLNTLFQKSTFLKRSCQSYTSKMVKV